MPQNSRINDITNRQEDERWVRTVYHVLHRCIKALGPVPGLNKARRRYPLPKACTHQCEIASERKRLWKLRKTEKRTTWTIPTRTSTLLFRVAPSDG